MASAGELVVADLPDPPRKLVCIEFPGIVEDETAAIERLGGLNTLSKAQSDGRRLEMRFRPDDQYCKPALSKTVTGSYLILKIRRKKADGNTLSESCDLGSTKVDFEYSAELMGISNKMYQFSGMVDYQVLPPGLNAISYKGLPVDPNDFQMKEPLESDFSERDIPSFLPPSCFSKFDKPINYSYRPYIKSSKPVSDQGSGAGRSKKFNLSYSLSFEAIGVPKEPKPDAVSCINSSNPLIPKIKELFEERPVWTRTALQLRLKSTQIRIRSVLPLLAYNFFSGPFKRLWVKLGYDPRSDPCNKIYQSLDIRVPKEVTIIEAQNRAKIGTNTTPGSYEGTSMATENVEETTCIFFPDKLPNQRQLCYQLCDIHDQEAQDLIHSNDGRETECMEVNGWCEENTYDKLRKLLNAKIKSLAERNMTGTFTFK